MSAVNLKNAIDQVKNTLGTIFSEKGNIFNSSPPLFGKRDSCWNFLMPSSPTYIFVISGILDEFKPATGRSVYWAVMSELPGWLYIMDD